MGKADLMLLSHCHGIEAEEQSDPILHVSTREKVDVWWKTCVYSGPTDLESAELSVEFLVELSFNPESIESSVEF